MNLDLAQKEFLKSEDGRKWFIDKIGRKKIFDHNGKLIKLGEVIIQRNQIQDYNTPYEEVCDKMISKTTLEGKKILVIFNLEFLERLIYKFGVSSNNIRFISDCNIESEIAKKIYRVKTDLIKEIDQIEGVITNMFDLCFSNPPYNAGADVDIISALLPFCNEIVVVHPAAWLLDNKCLERSHFTKYRKKIESYCESAYIFDGNSVFKIVGPCSPFTIFKINKKYKGKISVNYFDKQYFEVDSVYDITHFVDKWSTIVKPFLEIMKTKENIWDYEQRIKVEKKHLTPINKFYFQCRCLIPGTAGNDINDCLIQLSSNNERYIVSYNDIIDDKNNRRLKYYFNTLNEVNNFIEFLKTDFVRFCISIYKINQCLDTGELKLVPRMDFTRPWTDQDLYQHFNIPQETIDYITNFIPDYFGLRKKNETT